MPPAAITGTDTASAICGSNANSHRFGGTFAQEAAGVAARLEPLGDDCVD
jgi:hypothetical protein